MLRNMKAFKKEYVRKTTDNRWVTVYVLLAFMIGMITVGALWTTYNYFQGINQPMLNPLQGIENLIVKPVHAQESISCDNPRGYLACKAYQGVITWEDHDKLSKIIQCESRWNPSAVNTKNKNGTWDRGLLQSNSVHSKALSNEDAFNFKKNIDWGIKLFKKQGTRPWNSSQKCWNNKNIKN